METFFTLQVEQRSDGLQDVVVVPGLGDKIVRAKLHTLHGQLNAAPAGDEYHGDGIVELFDLPQQLHAFLAGGA